jgi:hypothetical protein
MVGPALAAGPSRDARDNCDGLPTSGSPTTVHRSFSWPVLSERQSKEAGSS